MPRRPIPAAFRRVLVRCASCGRRNAVDVARQGLRRARCGSCQAGLPRRLPAPLTVLALVGAGIAVALGWGAWRAVSDAGEAWREHGIREALEEGRPAEALGLLRPPPRRGGEADRARAVAERLIAPVADVADDPWAAPPAVAQAVARGDALVARHARRLPELVPVAEAALRELRARRRADELLTTARESAGRGDTPRAVQGHVEAAAARAGSGEHGAAVRSEVRRRGREVLASVILTLARQRSIAGGAAAARRVLEELPAAAPSLRPAADASPAAPAGEPGEVLAFSRRAVAERDLAALRRAVTVRPGPTWPTAEAASAERHLEAACRALASLATARAAEGGAPSSERARLLLWAVTCDEQLPADFVQRARRARATLLARAALAGEDPAIGIAIAAWGALPPGADRAAALRVLARRAEDRRRPSLAVIALRSLEDDALLALAFGAGPPPRLARTDVPGLEYPAVPAPPGEEAPR